MNLSDRFGKAAADVLELGRPRKTMACPTARNRQATKNDGLPHGYSAGHEKRWPAPRLLSRPRKTMAWPTAARQATKNDGPPHG